MPESTDAAAAVPEAHDLPLALWGWQGWTVEPWERLPGDEGYSSHTYLVRHDGVRHVVKAVRKDMGPKLTAGLLVAQEVERHGIAAGGPLPTTGGEVTAYQGDFCYSLLTYLDGERVDETDPAHLRAVGRTLGRIDSVLLHAPVPEGVPRWNEVLELFLLEQGFLEGHDWIRRTLEQAGGALSPDDLTIGLINCDAAAKEFRVLGDTAGLLDWSEAMYAPCMLELATTLSYLEDETDGEPLVRGYFEEGPADRAELGFLADILRFRCAAEGWIYAARQSAGDETGTTASTWSNEKLIERARQNAENADRIAARFQVF
ncbi:hypothetical protein CW362_39545 [Streptomyces populi]|uniref:Aminoglycoside phosphotransferase domain-containing protein n=1 Tax=Streptomyces populi TaxID=2058924 RepID=A0A2I0SCG5_9ACTN|nr:phosphotransferase [Streptomyces populi]PKT67610.1 hypothetical protein CW362_39545 [Streptomyces populi]